MNVYFIILAVLHVLSLGMYIASHGQPREGNYHSGKAFIAVCITLGLVYMAMVTGI